MSIRTRRKPMRAVAAAAAAAVGASLLAIAGPAPVGAAPTVTEQTRIAGADRYATANAVALAKANGATNIGTVVLVSGENFPDGLSASALAGALNAPMLLTQAAALPTSVLTALTSMTSTATVKNVVIVGGTSVVSADIATQLGALGFTVTRLAGANRYETANDVAAAVRVNNGGAIGTFGGLRTAFLASGENFPDALAASSWAYRNKHPLFLTDGATLTDDTIAAIQATGVQQIIILGGETAVSAEVATAAAGVTGVAAVTRVSGDTRYDTATALATTLATVDTDYKTRAMLVSGTNFPDALVAAQLAGAADSYAIIPVTDPLPAAVSSWATANQATLTTIRAIGGTAAVPASVVTAVDDAGTIAPITASITAADGAASFSVTFGAAVDATNAGTTGNYRVTSALGVIKSLSLTTAYNTTTRTVVIGVTGGLATGDTIQVLPASIQSSATSGLFVAATSTSVTADTTVPTVEITAFPTSNSATSGNSYLKRVWLTFSSNASMSVANGGAALLGANLLYKGPLITDVQMAAFTGCAPVGSTTTWTCDVDAAKTELVAGGTVYILASKFTSTASTPVANAATTATVTADTTLPTLTGATFSQSATGGTQASVTVGGDVTISARAATSVAGRAGNAVDVQTVVNPALATAPTCVYTAATNTVTISAATTTSALVLANACNTTASFNALFSASATTAGGLSGYSNAVLDMAGGADKVTTTLTFSEALGAAANANFTFTKATGAGATITTAAATWDGKLTGVLTVTYLTAGTIIGSVDTVSVATAVTDRVGNAIAAATSRVLTPA